MIDSVTESALSLSAPLWPILQSDAQPTVGLSRVGKAYGSHTAPITALHDVSLEIQAGEFCAIVGPSGSGKSTLMNLIGLLDHPTTGRIHFDGVDVSQCTQREAAQLRNRTHGFVFQSFQLLPRLTAWENVALPLLYRGTPKAARRQPAMAMLERVGLADRAHHRPDALSGGQKQRVAIARALIGDPKLLLADEPTGSLDSATAADVMALFAELNRTLGVTVVMVTHDRDLAARCGRQIEVLDGRILADRGAELSQ